MVCNKCGRPLTNGQTICQNCSLSMNKMSFQTNKFGENGKRGEYITEKLTGKQGVYEKASEQSKVSYLGLIIIGVIILIIVGIAIASFLA